MKPCELFKSENNLVDLKPIDHDSNPSYLNGGLEKIPENSEKRIGVLREWRKANPKKLIEFSDEMILYLTHPKVLQMQEKWSFGQMIWEFNQRFFIDPQISSNDQKFKEPK